LHSAVQTMTRKQALLVGAALVVIASVYALGRWSARAPAATVQSGLETGPMAKAAEPTPALPARAGGALPLASLPLATTFADLQGRASAGDAAAAKRLVRDLDRCSRLRALEWKNSATTRDLLDKQTEAMGEAQLRTYQLLLDAMELRQQNARAEQQLCSGVDRRMLDSLVASIAQAARLGDEQARACYLAQGPLYSARSLLEQPELLRGYRKDAAALIEAGLAAGDWKVVDLLQQAYEPGAQSLLAGMVGSDPAQHYRYLKLYRLGAEPHRAAKLDRRIAAIAAALPPEQVYDADRWAQATFKQNFGGSSTAATPLGWDACAF
jgi:hypothetical protein